MNGFPPLGALRRTIRDTLADLLGQRFFRDRLSVALLVAAVLVNVLNLCSLALYLRPTPAALPIRFSSLTLFDALGPWYFPFVIALFALGVTAINAWLAYRTFSRSRIASFGLLTGAGVVAVFGFIISMAFGAVR